MRLTLIPAWGCSSYRVTDGPRQMSSIVVLTPKLSSVLTRMSAFFFISRAAPASSSGRVALKDSATDSSRAPAVAPRGGQTHGVGVGLGRTGRRMDGRTGRVADSGADLHAGSLPRRGTVKLLWVVSAAGRVSCRGSRCGGVGIGCRGRSLDNRLGRGGGCLGQHIIQHFGDRAPGLPGSADRTAGIAEAAAQCRDRCGNSGGLRCGGHSCGGGRTQRRSVCGHLCSKISRRKDHRIALHTACHIQLRQLDRGSARAHPPRGMSGVSNLGSCGPASAGLKLGRLRQVQRCLGTDLLRRIVKARGR